MRSRKAMIGFAAAMLLAFAAAQADAKTLICKTKKGDVFHNGKDGSMCEAVADGTSKSQAKATGPNSFAESTSDSHGNAKSNAINGGNAQAAAFGDPGKCKATAKAMEAGSTAFAQCEVGGFANATATAGGTADAFDDKAPTCNPGASGTAIVTSTFGNCSAP
jgi:hypothetical protein